MNVLIDIILVFAFAYCVLRYSKVGLLTSVLRFSKPTLALLLSVSLGGIASDLIYGFLAVESGGKTYLLAIMSSILGHISVFAISFILISMIIDLISSVKIPIISKIDRVLGAFLGIFVGFVIASAISTGAFSVLSALHNTVGDSVLMNVYHDSFVFKNVYNLRFFEFIKELI